MTQKNLLLIFIIIAVVVGGAGFLAHTLVKNADNPNGKWKDFVITEGLSEKQPPLTLKNMKGEDVDLLKAYPGKTLLVNYWATWCPPCITEIPSLRILQQKRQSETFDVVFISLDFPKSTEALAKLMERAGLADLDTLYMTDARQWSSLGGRGLPISVLIDPQGNVMSRMVGGIEWTGPMADDFLKNVR